MENDKTLHEKEREGKAGIPVPETVSGSVGSPRPVRLVRALAWGFGVAFILAVTFATGMFAGLQKARFSYDWGRNYERNFVASPHMGRPGPMDRFEGRGYRNGHGLAGEVISVSDGSLAVKDRSGRESAVKLTDKTVIRSGDVAIAPSDLKPGDRVAVIGRPSDDGSVQAEFVRVFPTDAPQVSDPMQEIR